MKDVFEILKEMENACPVSCYCSISNSVNGMELIWRFNIKGISYGQAVAIREQEVTEANSVDIISMNIQRAAREIRRRFNQEQGE